MHTVPLPVARLRRFVLGSSGLLRLLLLLLVTVLLLERCPVLCPLLLLLFLNLRRLLSRLYLFKQRFGKWLPLMLDALAL